MSTASMPTSVMDRLKAETAEHHARAEGKALQRAMVSGGLSASVLADFFEQMHLVHAALEAEIDRHRGAEPMLAVIPDEQRHSKRLAEDLAFHGRSLGAVKTLASTRGLVSAMADAARVTPASLLGLHYVLEGSMNGNRYIAMALRRTLGLTPGQGDAYLDPYGDQQRPKWIAFRAAVDALPWTPAKADAALSAARRMFDGVGEISDEVWARAQGKA